MDLRSALCASVCVHVLNKPNKLTFVFCDINNLIQQGMMGSEGQTAGDEGYISSVKCVTSSEELRPSWINFINTVCSNKNRKLFEMSLYWYLPTTVAPHSGWKTPKHNSSAD